MAKTTICNAKALGASIALVSALSMLFLSVLGWLGFGLKAVEAMIQWHIYYSLSIGGVIAGIVEALVFGYIVGYLIEWFYNKYN